MDFEDDDKSSRRKPKDDNSPEAVGARLIKSCGEMVDIRLPNACEEPILAPTVRRAVIEWMTEIHMAEELKAVGLVPRYTSLLYGPPGCGKAQPFDAPVLRAGGEWAAISHLRVGDGLASLDGCPSLVEGVFPQGELDVWQVEFSDGAVVECGEDHLWTVESKEWRAPKVIRTGDLPGMLTRPSMAGRLRVPLFAGDYGYAAALPLEPYLLGLLIGDGCFTSGGCVLFCAPTQEILERFTAALPESDEAKHISRFDYRITRKQRDNSPSDVRQALDGLGLSGCKSYDKFIPRSYLAASKESRRRLLKGLLDTDGYTERGCRVCYSTSSEQLANDVRDLVNSLGGIVSVRPKSPTYTYGGEKHNGRPAWVITLLTPFGRDLATLERHKKNLVEFSGKLHIPRKFVSARKTDKRAPMVCIKVSHPSATYITNNYVVTHNTTMAHHFAARLGMPLVIVRGELVQSKWVSETGNNIGCLFNYFRVERGPFVVLFDELDAIASARRETGTSAGKEQNAIVAALLTNIEAFEGIFFAATNRQDSLDPAIWRRFGMQLEVALPGFEERFAILRRYGLPFEFSDDFLDELALGTETAAPSLLRQVMEGFKRTLVIGPRLKRDISDPAALLRSIVAAVRPHPDYSTPPLWTSPKAVDGFVKFKGADWPPKRPRGGA